MLPAAITQHVLDELVPLLEKDDVVIDGELLLPRRHRARGALRQSGIHYVDCALAGACGDSNAATA